jgi:hypothetical protein
MTDGATTDRTPVESQEGAVDVAANRVGRRRDRPRLFGANDGACEEV